MSVCLSNSSISIGHIVGIEQYKLANHQSLVGLALGVFLTIVTDNKLVVNSSRMVSGYVALTVSSSDYHPFGSMHPKRNFNTGDNRFGFNGQKMVNEVSGIRNTNTVMFWECYARIGKRWNTDPVVKPWESTYLCFSGNPILVIDPNADFYNKAGEWIGY